MDDMHNIEYGEVQELETVLTKNGRRTSGDPMTTGALD